MTYRATVFIAFARVDRGEDRHEDMVSYGAQDLLDYAPVAKQNLTTGVMSVAEMCKAGGAERQCLRQSVGRLPTEWKIGDKTGNNGSDDSGDIAIAWLAAGGLRLHAARPLPNSSKPSSPKSGAS